MARVLNILGNNENLGISNSGLKLSKSILLENIEDHEEFKKLFSIDEQLLERIVGNMKTYGFDNSQPIHIWIVTIDGVEHKYLIDGYTRVKGARIAGLLSVPYYEHKFETFDEAYKYVLQLQVNRRNLEGDDLLKNIIALMGTDYIQNFEGNKNKEIARLTGKSEKTIERASFVAENATEEQLEQIRNNEKSVNETFNDIKDTQYIEENATEETKQEIEDGLVSKKQAVKQIKEQKKKESRHVSADEKSDDDTETFDTDFDAFDTDFVEEDDFVDDSLSEDTGVRGVSVHQRKEDDSPKLTPPRETEEDVFIRKNRTLLQEATINGFKSGLMYVLEKIKVDNIDCFLTEETISELSNDDILEIIKNQ